MIHLRTYTCLWIASLFLSQCRDCQWSFLTIDFRCEQVQPLCQMLQQGHSLSGQAAEWGFLQRLKEYPPPLHSRPQISRIITLQRLSIKGIYKAPITLASKHWTNYAEARVLNKWCFSLCSPGLQRNENLDGQGSFAVLFLITGIGPGERFYSKGVSST